MLAGQVQLDLDPSLPLDNLTRTSSARTLFSDWPQVDAIVGNPPFLGGQKIRKELGVEYLERLQRDSGVNGVVDMACYWFRRAHERQQTPGVLASWAPVVFELVVPAKHTRFIVANGPETITNAASSRIWPGKQPSASDGQLDEKKCSGGPFVLLVDDVAYESQGREPSPTPC